MSHSPGPWEGRNLPEGMPTSCIKFGVIGYGGREVARVWKPEDVDLISSAPEMLEVLESILRTYPTHADTQFLIAIENARNVIDKAKGKA